MNPVIIKRIVEFMETDHPSVVQLADQLEEMPKAIPDGKTAIQAARRFKNIRGVKAVEALVAVIDQYKESGKLGDVSLIEFVRFMIE